MSPGAWEIALGRVKQRRPGHPSAEADALDITRAQLRPVLRLVKGVVDARAGDQTAVGAALRHARTHRAKSVMRDACSALGPLLCLIGARLDNVPVPIEGRTLRPVAHRTEDAFPLVGSHRPQLRGDGLADGLLDLIGPRVATISLDGSATEPRYRGVEGVAREAVRVPELQNELRVTHPVECPGQRAATHTPTAAAACRCGAASEGHLRALIMRRVG
mmetsp:Transcript_49622/g.106294  ORF Transcript_49622/g.106294 Transcript_49622/m.106294 type:complete len:218 (-) Transcript_49622:902-1555(-)